MKIKIIAENEVELAVFQDGVFKIGSLELNDVRLDFDRDVVNFLESDSILNITDSMDTDTPFFYSVTLFSARLVVSSCQCIGYLRIDEDGGIELVETSRVSGDSMQLVNGDRVLISSFQPSNFSFIPGYENSILTSDGLVILDSGSFLGNKDGSIAEFTTSDLLQQISLSNAEKSPLYDSITLNPVLTLPANPREGTLILNAVTGKLELFIDDGWKTVNPEGENENP
jgi:hypothetical protein